MSEPSSNKYLRYTSLCFQMLGTIVLGVLLGKWLDKKLQTTNHIYTALLSLLFVVASMYIGIRQILKDK